MAEDILRNTFSLRTGEAHLRSVPAEHQLMMALSRLGGDVPVDPIIHELVHHVSGNSIVNAALQYRWLALLRFSLSTPTLGLDWVSREIAANLVATEALLQPFAEGLAHFAEFDCAVTDPSNPILTAYDGVAIRLLSLRPDTTEQLADFRRASVEGKRLATQVARRADVLAHPVRPNTMNEAYLLGYLLVKTAWNRYVEGGGPCPAGAFLEFLNYWFYEDWRLAALLADLGSAGVDAVAGRLRRRTELLLADDIVDRVATFMIDKEARQERGMLPRGPDERLNGPFAGLGLSADDVDDGHLALNRLYASRIGPRAPLNPFQDPIAVNVINLIYEQMMMNVPPDHHTALDYAERNPHSVGEPLRVLDFVLELAELKRALGLMVDIPVEIALADRRLAAIRVDGSEWQPFPWPMSIEVDGDGSDQVRLVGLVMSAQMPWSIHWFLVSGLRFVGGWSHAVERDDDHTRHLALVLQYEEGMRIATETTFSELAALTSLQLLGDDSGVETLADASTARIAKALRDVLAVHGWEPLLTAPAAGVDGGLRNLVPGHLVTALAIVGLVNSYSLARSEVAAQLEIHGFDLNEVVEAFDNLASAQGLRLLDVDSAAVRARA